MKDRPENLSGFRIWIHAARPKTLWAGIVPVVIGGAIAFKAGNANVLPFALALAGSILIQIGTNLANDLFDYLKSVDDDERTGPLRVTQAGLVSPFQMKAATIAVFSLAIVVGSVLVWIGGLPVFLIGCFSILCGVMYTAGPYPLGYHGLGDIFVLVFYGPVAVCGTYYVMTLEFEWLVMICGLAPGMLSTAILIVNNLRDVDSDARSGKKTLAVKFGRGFARMEFSLMTAGAVLIPAIIVIAGSAGEWALLPLAVSIPAVYVIMGVYRRDGVELNRVLTHTGRLLAFYGLLFSIGWNL
jgi:1,4-dihydroxy-2-naphthoate octaprenyltransferase